MTAQAPSYDLVISDDRSERERSSSLVSVVWMAGSGAAGFLAALVVAVWIVTLGVTTWSSVARGGSWETTGLLWAFFALGVGLYRTLLQLAQRTAQDA